MGVEVVRFHVETGPAPLFVRVRQVLAGVRRLRLHGAHLAERIAGQDAPLAHLEKFDPELWQLMLVEARTDTGKFVSTSWRRSYPGGDWWVVIGFGDTVRTLYRASQGKRGQGENIVTGGPLWDLVNEVNGRLVAPGVEG